MKFKITFDRLEGKYHVYKWFVPEKPKPYWAAVTWCDSEEKARAAIEVLKSGKRFVDL